MCSEVVDPDELLTEFQDVAKQLNEVLEDLKWRKPDVEEEEAKLRDLRKAAKKDSGVDVASQAVAVRVLRAVLDDKIALANKLEKRMNKLKAQLEKAEVAAAEKEEGETSGEAVQKKED